MTIELDDIVTAILNVTENPCRKKFKPGEISKYLKNNGFNDLDIRYISAHVSNKLNYIRDNHNNIIGICPHNKQARNRLHVIKGRKSLEGLRDLNSATGPAVQPSTRSGASPVHSSRPILREPEDNNRNSYPNSSKNRTDDNSSVSVNNIFYSNLLEIKDRLANLESLLSKTQPKNESNSSKMISIIESYDCFKEHFCPDYIKERLGDIPLCVYHQVVKDFFDIVKFKSANSQRLYTQYPDEMPLLTLGKLTGDGKMIDKRFGITCYTQAQKLKLDPGLYIFINENTYEELILECSNEIDNKETWRGNHFILPKIPLAILKDNGWFLRKLRESDKATKLLEKLAKFSKTDPGTVNNLGINGAATPLAIRIATGAAARNE